MYIFELDHWYVVIFNRDSLSYIMNGNDVHKLESNYIKKSKKIIK